MEFEYSKKLRFLKIKKRINELLNNKDKLAEIKQKDGLESDINNIWDDNKKVY
jgi:hypothetical protein